MFILRWPTMTRSLITPVSSAFGTNRVASSVTRTTPLRVQMLTPPQTKERSMSTPEFRQFQASNSGGDWRTRVGFLGHDNVPYLWDAVNECWTPVAPER